MHSLLPAWISSRSSLVFDEIIYVIFCVAVWEEDEGNAEGSADAMQHAGASRRGAERKVREGVFRSCRRYYWLFSTVFSLTTTMSTSLASDSFSRFSAGSRIWPDCVLRLQHALTSSEKSIYFTGKKTKLENWSWSCRSHAHNLFALCSRCFLFSVCAFSPEPWLQVSRLTSEQRVIVSFFTHRMY